MNEITYYPLTSSQKSFASHVDYIGSLGLLTELACVEFKNRLNEPVFLEALKETAKRLPYCNVRFHHEEDGTVLQYLSSEEPDPVEVVDLTTDDINELDDQFRTWSAEAFPANYDDKQMYKFFLLHYPDGHQGLLFCFLHLIMDGYAAINTLKYVSKSYSALLEGTELPAAAPLPWKLVSDDLSFHDSPRYQAGLEKLSTQFDTEPHFTCINGVGSPEFIEGKRYGKAQELTQYAGDIFSYPLPDALYNRVEAAAKALNVSAQTYYLLALDSYLGQVSNTDDVSVLELLSCRSTRYEKQVGMNTYDGQIVRSILPGRMSFTDALIKLSVIQNESMRYSKVLVNDVLAQISAKHNLPSDCTYYTAMITYFAPIATDEGGLDLSVRIISNGIAPVPLYILIMPDSNKGSMCANYWYAIGYIQRESIERYHSFMLRFLENGLNAPEKPLKDLIDASL